MRVFYHGANVYTVAGVRLMPGLNEVEDYRMAAFEANAGVKDRIAKGVITIERGQRDLTTADVAGMTDVARLREMAEGDKRSSITKAAISRLEEIDAQGAE